MSNTFFIKILRQRVLPLIFALAFLSAVRLADANSTQLISVGSATVLRQSDLVIGALPAHENLHVVVALKLRNRAALDEFVNTMTATPSALTAHQTMSADQLSSQHLPTADQSRAVADFLTNAGLTNVTVTPNYMLVSADGAANVVEAAFHTAIVQVQTAKKEIAYANVADVFIPAQLQDIVLSVLGLQNIHNPRSFLRSALTATPSASGVAITALRGYNPLEFSSIYGADGSVPTAAGIAVGIITQGNIAQTITDLNTFTSANGLATVTTQTVNINGTSNDTSNLEEWNLDSQAVVGMAGGQVGKLIFYNMKNMLFSDLTLAFNAIVQANATKIINVSMGYCETAVGNPTILAHDQFFLMGMSQGQTFAVASGDFGADGCQDGLNRPVYPASSRYVVAVGGTTLTTAGSTYASETAWGDSGGSLSAMESRPSWQAVVNSSSFRAVPDIAFDADPASGARIIVRNVNLQFGGTSLAAPIFAGAWARILAAHPNVGFAAPRLYNKLTAIDYHDVTTGNNGSENARAGYDLVTGFGSLILSKVNQHILIPIITSPTSTKLTVTETLSFQVTADEQSVTYSATGLPPFFVITSSGLVVGISDSPGIFAVTVTATASAIAGGASGSAILTIQILPKTVITSAGPVSGFLETPFGFTLTANQQVTFTATGLPPGLMLNGASGLMSGIPTMAGSYNVIATAKNIAGYIVERAIVINIVPPPPPVITSKSGPQCITVAQPFIYKMTADRAATFSVSGLPASLFQSPNNMIQGQVRRAGNYSVRLTASNVTGSTSVVMVIEAKAIGSSCDLIPPSPTE